MTEHFPLILPNFFNLTVASPAAWQISSSVTHVHGSATVWGRIRDCQTDIVFKTIPTFTTSQCTPGDVLTTSDGSHKGGAATHTEVSPHLHTCVHCALSLLSRYEHNNCSLVVLCVSLWCYIRNLNWKPNTLNNLCSHFHLTLISLLSASVFRFFWCFCLVMY